MYRQQVVELTHHINSLLGEHVAIHDDLFKVSLRRVLPIPGFFQAMNFHRFLLDITRIEGSLEAARAQAFFLLNEISDMERDYVMSLMLYIDALLKTVCLFVNIVERLKLKNEGRRYGWFTYRRDLKEYRRSTNRYTALGKELNNNWQQYRLGEVISFPD
jgi:hypothetical protein